MKLVVIIPAYNEEKSIASVIRDVPRDIKGIDSVSIAVIDDGSTDETAEESKKAGADRIVSFDRNRGLASAFKTGLDVALELKADIIVNIDADGQYDAKEIPDVIRPVLDKEADLVLGSRFKGWIEEMPFQKRIGNQIATKITGFLSGFPCSDTQTGFRAFSREAALRLNVLSDYTYVQETIIQAVNRNLSIREIPIHFRKRNGKSRLIRDISTYVKRAGITILRTYLHHKPLEIFAFIGSLLVFMGFLIGLRVIIHFLKTGLVSPYIPSAILTAVLIIVGFQVIAIGLLADLIYTNRKLEEDILYRLKRGNG